MKFLYILKAEFLRGRWNIALEFLKISTSVALVSYRRVSYKKNECSDLPHGFLLGEFTPNWRDDFGQNIYPSRPYFNISNLETTLLKISLGRKIGENARRYLFAETFKILTDIFPPKYRFAEIFSTRKFR